MVRISPSSTLWHTTTPLDLRIKSKYLEYDFKGLISVVLIWRWFCSHKTFDNVWTHFCCHTGGWRCYCHLVGRSQECCYNVQGSSPNTKNYPAWNINSVEVEKWEMLHFMDLTTAYFLISSLLLVPLISIQLFWCHWRFHFLSHFQIFINTVLSTWNTLCSPFPHTSDLHSATPAYSSIYAYHLDSLSIGSMFYSSLYPYCSACYLRCNKCLLKKYID